MEDYRTTDLPLACFLILKGFELLNLDVSNPKRVEFSFDSNALEQVEEYWEGAKIPAIRFALELRKLKTKMYEEIKNDRTEKKKAF